MWQQRELKLNAKQITAVLGRVWKQRFLKSFHWHVNFDILFPISLVRCCSNQLANTQIPCCQEGILIEPSKNRTLTSYKIPVLSWIPKAKNAINKSHHSRAILLLSVANSSLVSSVCAFSSRHKITFFPGSFSKIKWANKTETLLSWNWLEFLWVMTAQKASRCQQMSENKNGAKILLKSLNRTAHNAAVKQDRMLSWFYNNIDVVISKPRGLSILGARYFMK